MKQHLRSLWTLLLLMMWCSVGLAAAGDTFTLVTAESELKAGDVIIIVNQSTKMALSTEQRDYNRGACAITISGKDVTKANNAQEITLEGASGAWYFNVGNGYLYAASSSANQLLTQTEKDDNSKAQITFSSSSATIKFLGNNSRNLLKYNSSSKIFSCYSKGQSAVAIYKKKSTKTATTLTFPKSIFNIEEGNEATFTGQPATLKAGGTVLNNAITYTTNNDDMFEAYDTKVGPKTLKTGKYGTAIVTAKFNGDNTYEASTATYTVNYTEKEKPATTLDFGFTTKTVNIDEKFTAAATLKSGETAITGAVTYSSSTPEVADVDKTTGEVLAFAAGKTTITATFAGTSEYKSSTASYELTVVDPNIIETSTTFDFTKPEKYNYGVTNINDNGGTPAFGTGEGDVTLNKTIVSDDVTITNTKVDGYGTRFWNNTDLRVYSNNEHVVSVPDGYYITSIVIKATNQSKYAKYKIGDKEIGKDWTGNAQSVTITYTGNSRLTSMEVTYTKPSYKDLPLNETTTAEDARTLLGANLNKTVNVTINRTLVANKWNTLCLPFDVTAEQIKNILKAEGMVREYADEDATAQTITFKKVEGNMKAGEPYLIKPTEDITSLAFEGVTITAVEGNLQGKAYGICGTLGKYAMKTDGTELFLNAAGKFVAPAAATNTMKGFRAYFMVPKGSSAAALNINFDGETTGINNIETEATVNGKVYNLNGQYVGNSLNGLKKGIYVVNGKKVIK